MKIGVAGTIASIAMVCTVSTASATVLDVTYTGVISGGTYESSFFGTINQGDAYTAFYEFDSSVKDIKNYNGEYGGTDFSNQSPNVETKLTINGKTLSFEGLTLG